MSLDRRGFLGLTAAGLAASVLSSAGTVHAAKKSKIKALAFDGFPIFDPRPIFAMAEQLFPGKGAELSNAWRTRQFEYQWLRALMNKYADFWQATEDALVFAAELLKLDLTADKRKQLMNGYLELKAWPDVASALASLKQAGLKLGFLSNLTPKILEAGMKNSGLEKMFDHAISTDVGRTFKPDPRAYQMGVDVFGLAKEEILFVAFAGWDAAGAKSFGYPTFWVNRLGLPPERLGALPDGTGKGMADLVDFVNKA